MRAERPGAKPNQGYIAITFSRPLDVVGAPHVSGDAAGDKPKRSLWLGVQFLGAEWWPTP